jgi:hypothetical protein
LEEIAPKRGVVSKPSVLVEVSDAGAARACDRVVALIFVSGTAGVLNWVGEGVDIGVATCVFIEADAGTSENVIGAGGTGLSAASAAGSFE